VVGRWAARRRLGARRRRRREAESHESEDPGAHGLFLSALEVYSGGEERAASGSPFTSALNQTMAGVSESWRGVI
jgi:hypothetical protein